MTEKEKIIQNLTELLTSSDDSQVLLGIRTAIGQIPKSCRGASLGIKVINLEELCPIIEEDGIDGIYTYYSSKLLLWDIDIVYLLGDTKLCNVFIDVG